MPAIQQEIQYDWKKTPKNNRIHGESAEGTWLSEYSVETQKVALCERELVIDASLEEKEPQVQPGKTEW